MERDMIIAGNWKMNKTVDESIRFIQELEDKLKGLESDDRLSRMKIILFPASIALPSLKGSSRIIQMGSQNIYSKNEGAYTGEISAIMIRDYANYTLVGHSERRGIFGESDEEVYRKTRVALDAGLIPIVCVGETLDDRESGNTFKKIGGQLSQGLHGLRPDSLDRLFIAYEPVWAIGTGKTATPEIAEEVHLFIRRQMASMTGTTYMKPILYGGSVNPGNCRDLLSQPDINGLLIGGASLKPDSFFDIISASLELI